MDKLTVLYIGDIFGKAGKTAVQQMIPYLREQYKPHIVIANAENIAGGFGITQNLAQKVFRYGVDVITLGNHTWNKRDELFDILDSHEHIVRPINYPPGNQGHGYTVFTTEFGTKVAVMNLMGRVYMPTIDCPFRVGKDFAERLRMETPIIIVDFHAEATSEKVAMGYHLDGFVSAVIGTHTHILTADEKILPGGTAYITDCGMTGPHDSVIGVKKELALEHFLKAVQVRFEPANEGIRLQGVAFDIDVHTGKALSIQRVDIPLEN